MDPDYKYESDKDQRLVEDTFLRATAIETLTDEHGREVKITSYFERKMNEDGSMMYRFSDRPDEVFSDLDELIAHRGLTVNLKSAFECQDLSAKTLVGVRRTAWICKYCDGVYADDPVSSCDCLGADGQTPPHFVEGEIKYLQDIISTPETDAAEAACRESKGCVNLVFVGDMADLERRLTIAREGFKNLIDAVEHGDFSSGEYSLFEMDLAKKALKLTAPNP